MLQAPRQRFRALGLVTLAGLQMACVAARVDPLATPFPTRIALPLDRIALPDRELCRGDGGGAPCVDAGYAVFGILHESKGCIWYSLGTVQDVRVIWPMGYSAHFDPFIVYNNQGDEVARDGDWLQVAGGGPFEGDADVCGRSSFVVFSDPVTGSDTPP